MNSQLGGSFLLATAVVLSLFWDSLGLPEDTETRLYESWVVDVNNNAPFYNKSKNTHQTGLP